MIDDTKTRRFKLDFVYGMIQRIVNHLHKYGINNTNLRGLSNNLKGRKKQTTESVFYQIKCHDYEAVL